MFSEKLECHEEFSRGLSKSVCRILTYIVVNHYCRTASCFDEGSNQYLMVCTGGGPGFMEAANKGASRVKGARNMGMGITLPFEEGRSDDY